MKKTWILGIIHGGLENQWTMLLFILGYPSLEEEFVMDTDMHVHSGYAQFCPRQMARLKELLYIIVNQIAKSERNYCFTKRKGLAL